MKLDPPFWQTLIAVAKTRWRRDLFILSAIAVAALLYRWALL